jgi:putative peptidoglycan lipid II flippase
MLVLLTSRVVGLLREAIVAKEFGAGPKTDAFFAAFRIPDLLYNSLLTFLVGIAVIPVLSQFLVKNDRSPAWRYWSSAVNVLLIGLIPVVVLGEVFAGELVSVLAPGLDREASALAARLARLMLPIILFGAITGAIKAALESLQRFLVPAFIPLVYNVCVIAAVLTLGRYVGVTSLALGVFAAAVAQVGFQLPTLTRAGVRYSFNLTKERDALAKSWRIIYPTLAAILIGNIVPAVEVHLASLAMPGAISYLSYANRLFLIPDQIFATALSTVLFPLFAAAVSSGDHPQMVQRLSGAIRLTLIVIAPLGLLMAVLSVPIVSVLLGRGAFDRVAVEGTARALAAYSWALVALCIKSPVTFAFFALHDSVTLLKVTVWGTVINVGLDLLLFRWFSYPGLALGMAATTCLQAGVLLILLHRRIGGLGGQRVLGLLPKVALGVAVMAVAVKRLATKVIPSGATSFPEAVLALTLLCSVAVIIYLSVVWLCRVEEARRLVASVAGHRRAE